MDHVAAILVIFLPIRVDAILLVIPSTHLVAVDGVIQDLDLLTIEIILVQTTKEIFS